MIHLSFRFWNPFTYRFENTFSKSWKVSKNKAFEFELLRNSVLLGAEFGLTFRQDHAGITVGLTLFGYEVHAELYDTRHWNYKQGRWNVYNEKGEPT